MFFIILTTGITLNRHGLTHIETTREAAEALRLLPADSQPLCLLWVCRRRISRHSDSRRVVGIRLRRNAGWAPGPEPETETGALVLHADFALDRCGVGLNFAGVNPVKALYWTAVINGLLAPFLLVAILVVAADKKLMQGQPSSRLSLAAVAITTVAMFAAGIAMFVFRQDAFSSGI